MCIHGRHRGRYMPTARYPWHREVYVHADVAVCMYEPSMSCQGGHVQSKQWFQMLANLGIANQEIVVLVLSMAEEIISGTPSLHPRTA